MSRNVIDSLKAWKLRSWPYETKFKKDTESPKLPLARTLREVERSARQPAVNRAQVIKEEWEPGIAPSEPGPVARCQLIRFTGELAECIVILEGIELPNVGFPAPVLRQKGVAAGARFHWIMRDGSRIRPGDIDADVPQTDEMTDAERANLDRLYEEFKRARTEDSGIWPEYTGPGR